ncbi:MAG: hypothetical protein JW929_12930 [Anaerolineales bacterium]|nr:hypothetical protein [Anaerolineales bacterium]
MLDILEIPPRPGVEIICADFFSYVPNANYDLVLCLEVLEHQQDPAGFAGKLMELGRTLILSVPYCWPSGLVLRHIQDPGDEAKIKSWMGYEPVESVIVEDANRFRMVAVYKREQEAWRCSLLGLPGPPIKKNGNGFLVWRRWRTESPDRDLRISGQK